MRKRAPVTRPSDAAGDHPKGSGRACPALLPSAARTRPQTGRKLRLGPPDRAAGRAAWNARLLSYAATVPFGVPHVTVLQDAPGGVSPSSSSTRVSSADRTAASVHSRIHPVYAGRVRLALMLALLSARDGAGHAGHAFRLGFVDRLCLLVGPAARVGHRLLLSHRALLPV